MIDIQKLQRPQSKAWDERQVAWIVTNAAYNKLLVVMKEYRDQLGRMGELFADSTRPTILRNVPESWRLLIAQTIQMMAHETLTSLRNHSS